MDLYYCSDCKKEFKTFEEFADHQCQKKSNLIVTFEKAEELEAKKETDFQEKSDETFGGDESE